MSTDYVTFDNRVWGAPEPTARHWGTRETVAAVGIAAAIAGLGGAAIYAATGTSSPAIGPPPGNPSFSQAGRDAAGPAGPAGPAGQGEVALHGQFVVSDHGGGYTTVLTQTGTVTAASPTSVTVRSADGFSQTYETPAGQGPSPASVNDTVMVRAIGMDGTAIATQIVDPQTRAALPSGLGGPAGPGSPP